MSVNTEHLVEKANTVENLKQPDKDKSQTVKLDIERLNTALDAEVFTIPKGLSREQKRQFIIGSAS